MFYRATYCIATPHEMDRVVSERQPRCLVLESETRLGAYCAAFDYLTRLGFDVRRTHNDRLLGREDWHTLLKDHGLPASSMEYAVTGCITISELVPYELKYSGSVVDPEEYSNAREATPSDPNTPDGDSTPASYC